MKKLTALFILGLLVSAVWAGSKAPDWINGISKKYPVDAYIIGIGIGDTVDGARSAARAEIAKVFKSRVAQAAQDISKEKTVQEGKKSKTSSYSETSLQTNTSTDEVLEGVEISETWFNEKSKVHYGLAVLNKQKTRVALAHALSNAEEATQALMSAAKQSASVIDKILSLNKALLELNKKDLIAAKMRVVSPGSGMDLPSGGASRGEIQKQLEESKSKLVFKVDAGEDTNNLKEAVSAAISKQGFRTIETSLEAGATLIMVNCKIEASPLDRGNPQWKFYNWSATANLVETTNDKTFSNIAKQGQASHTTEDGAKSKAITESKKELARAVEESISQNILGVE